MSAQDTNIVKTARRMIDKLDSSKYYKMNGEFPSGVQLEIKRMKHHCKEDKQVKSKSLT